MRQLPRFDMIMIGGDFNTEVFNLQDFIIKNKNNCNTYRLVVRSIS